MSCRRTEKADRDLIDIYVDGCRKFGRTRAERYYEGLTATFDLIATNPRIARERIEFIPAVRLHPYHSHMIVYLLDGAGVLIIRVLHGRQEWEKHL